MSLRNGPLSPVSLDSNTDWPPANPPQKSADASHPHSNGGYGNPYLITPPASVHTSADTLHTDGGMSKAAASRRPSNGNPSPPSSIGRSSVASQMDSRRQFIMEEALAEHYQTLKRFVPPSLRDQRGGPQQTKAKDKLRMLSQTLFQELSTDVFDELQRRQDEEAAGGRGAPGNKTPDHLLPKSNFHSKRNSARQKLSSLPRDRFRQLAADVFFELERRFPRFAGGRPSSPASSMMSGMSGRGPPPSGRARTPNGFGGSGPQPPPFRPPRGASVASNGGQPMPKTFQSNTIIPNKGTMVEDDDDYDNGSDEFNELLNGAAPVGARQMNGASDRYAAEQQEKIQELVNRIATMDKQLRDKDAELYNVRESSRQRDQNTGSEKAEFDRLQRDLEGKLSQAQNLNENLQNELERIRMDKARTEEDLRREMSVARREMDEMQRDLQSQLEVARQEARSALPGEDLQRRYEQMQDELVEQQRTTDEVRREALQYLTEMRAMSDNSAGNFEKEEKLAQQVSALEKELKEWKGRYARAKTQLRSMRASSAGLAAPPVDVGGVASALMDGQGLVKDVHVTKFQIGVDELLQAARRPDTTAVLDPMKSIVQAVRNLTSGVEGDDRSPISERSSTDTDSADPTKQQSKLKSKVSATANNLITAAKNHAVAQGLSPVSLVDAAASHLTTAVIELVKLVKIRPTPADELDEEDSQLPPLSGGLLPRKSYNGLSNGLRTHSSHLSKSSIGSGTGYSMTSSPRRGEVLSSRTSDGDSPGFLPNKSPPIGLGVEVIREDPGPGYSAGLYEYKTYLEDQTALLVQNIQPLVNTIRSGASSPEAAAAVEGYVGEISRAILEIKETTATTVQETGNRALAMHAPAAVDVLEDCRKGLVEKAEKGEKGRAEMPPLAFKIARATKELVLRVDRIESGELSADMAYPLET